MSNPPLANEAENAPMAASGADPQTSVHRRVCSFSSVPTASASAAAGSPSPMHLDGRAGPRTFSIVLGGEYAHSRKQHSARTKFEAGATGTCGRAAACAVRQWKIIAKGAQVWAKIDRSGAERTGSCSGHRHAALRTQRGVQLRLGQRGAYDADHEPSHAEDLVVEEASPTDREHLASGQRLQPW